MYIFDEFSMSGHKTVINVLFKSELEQALHIIESVEWTTGDSKKTNSNISMQFSKFGWIVEKTIYSSPSGWTYDKQGKISHSVDFYKNGLAVEIQFGRRGFVMEDIGPKSLAFSEVGVKALLEFIPSNNIHKELDGSTGWFENVKQYLETFKNVSPLISIPTIIYGFDKKRAS